jgi:hypothetical protein
MQKPLIQGENVWSLEWCDGREDALLKTHKSESSYIAELCFGRKNISYIILHISMIHKWLFCAVHKVAMQNYFLTT